MQIFMMTGGDVHSAAGGCSCLDLLTGSLVGSGGVLFAMLNGGISAGSALFDVAVAGAASMQCLYALCVRRFRIACGQLLVNS